jgi:hypothetical protein
MADHDWGQNSDKIEGERKSSLKEIYKGGEGRDARTAPISKTHADDRSEKQPPRKRY